MNKKTRIIKKAKAFVSQKAGKTIRTQVLDLCIPIMSLLVFFTNNLDSKSLGKKTWSILKKIRAKYLIYN